MRLFTAIELPTEVTSALAFCQQSLRQGMRCRSWTPIQNMHLTIHFFGEVAPDRVEELSVTLARGSRATAPFDLALGELGRFPKRGRARVIWVGLRSPHDELLNLEQALREAIAPLDLYHEDRPYSPHLTLARDPEGPVPDELRARAIAPATWKVDRFALVASELGATGARYTSLAQFPLSPV